MKNPNYILVTPARDEGKYIEETIRSVAHQTILPQRWTIVSDGSTDRTEAIIAEYQQKHSFIHLLRREPDPTRNFASKAYAIALGVANCAQVPYEYVGLMDADVSFTTCFFEKVLNRMELRPQLGIGGAAVYEQVSGRWTMLKASYNTSVGGQMQMFKRACYEAIGGYQALPMGGLDMVAETMVRMRGWDVKAFTDLQLFHHRVVGTAERSRLQAAFRRGRMEHANGYALLFQMLRFFTQLAVRPYVLGSLFRTAGYAWEYARREPLVVPEEFALFLRTQQMNRIKALLKIGQTQRTGSDASTWEWTPKEAIK